MGARATSSKQSGISSWSWIHAAVVGVLVLYVLLYAVVRWRLCIVMAECRIKETGRIVRQLRPGHDVRLHWVGRVKNWLNPKLYVVVRPLVAWEEMIRGDSR